MDYEVLERTLRPTSPSQGISLALRLLHTWFSVCGGYLARIDEIRKEMREVPRYSAEDDALVKRCENFKIGENGSAVPRREHGDDFDRVNRNVA